MVNGVASGSYVIEVIHPHLSFEPLRVEVNSKGKVRARELDNVQPFQVKNVVAYPLRMSCKGRFQYFQQREQWRISDLLFSPMVRFDYDDNDMFINCQEADCYPASQGLCSSIGTCYDVAKQIYLILL